MGLASQGQRSLCRLFIQHRAQAHGVCLLAAQHNHGVAAMSSAPQRSTAKWPTTQSETFVAAGQDVTYCLHTSMATQVQSLAQDNAVHAVTKQLRSAATMRPKSLGFPPAARAPACPHRPPPAPHSACWTPRCSMSSLTCTGSLMMSKGNMVALWEPSLSQPQNPSPSPRCSAQVLEHACPAVPLLRRLCSAVLLSSQAASHAGNAHRKASSINL